MKTSRRSSTTRALERALSHERQPLRLHDPHFKWLPARTRKRLLRLLLRRAGHQGGSRPALERSGSLGAAAGRPIRRSPALLGRKRGLAPARRPQCSIWIALTGRAIRSTPGLPERSSGCADDPLELWAGVRCVRPRGFGPGSHRPALGRSVNCRFGGSCFCRARPRRHRTDAEVKSLVESFGEAKVVAIVLQIAYSNFIYRLAQSLGLPVETGGPLPPLEVQFQKTCRRDGNRQPVPAAPATSTGFESLSIA